MTTDIIKQIRRATRRRFTAEEKIRIVLEGLRGEILVTERSLIHINGEEHLDKLREAGKRVTKCEQKSFRATVGRAEWFTVDLAKEKLLKGQVSFIEELCKVLDYRGPRSHAQSGTEEN